jgi:hypothetical protein
MKFSKKTAPFPHLGLICVIFKLKFVVNFQHLFFEEKALKYFICKMYQIQYFGVLACEIQ